MVVDEGSEEVKQAATSPRGGIDSEVEHLELKSTGYILIWGTKRFTRMNSVTKISL